jgi:uncharacterized membrane protein YccC
MEKPIMWAVLARLEHGFERIDPGAHRRIKGLRLVTAYGIAEALGSLKHIATDMPHSAALGTLAGNFALWASVSEARATRSTSSRDLAVLCMAGGLGAAGFALLAPWLQPYGTAWSEIILAVGAFLVGYLKRYGVTGAGVGSQIYIGQLLAYNAKLTPADLHMMGMAVLIAMLSAVVPRLLSGPAERPVLSPPQHCVAPRWRGLSPELVMGLHAGISSLVVVALDATFGLVEAVWAITACVYVIAGTASGTRHRVQHRIVGTLVGVPLGLLCLPLATNEPLLLWCAASLAMIVYAVALPNRYDIACGAFAFVLMVTLAVSGERSVAVLIARTWETILGGAMALAAASFLLPLRDTRECGQPDVQKR